VGVGEPAVIGKDVAKERGLDKNSAGKPPVTQARQFPLAEKEGSL